MAGQEKDVSDKQNLPRKRRLATVFDSVAGRVGVNGFLSKGECQLPSVNPSKPEEVLLRRLNAPDQVPLDYYAADEKLASKGQRLPDADLLRDLHTYVADFFENASEGDFNFRSFDETSLTALGILLEEACKEGLSESGDMVFSEPRSTDRGLPETKWTRHQIIGKVVPQTVQEYEPVSEEEEAELVQASSRKRRRRRYHDDDD